MSITKIGWFGDSQLDYMQYGLTRRRDDFIAAVDWVIRDMHKHGVTHAINAGDFLQSNRPSPHTINALQEMQRFLVDRGMSIYVISGNHDNARPHWVDILNQGNWQGFQLINYQRVSADGVSIYGVPNMSRDEFLKLKFSSADILLMHQAVIQFINFPSNNALDASELPFDKFQVIAMGDIHIHRLEPIQQLLSNPNVGFNCVMGYAGATELNSESEPDAKYWIELKFEDRTEGPGKQVAGWTMHRIPTRPIVRLEVREASQLDAVIDSLKATAAKLKEQDPREPIVFLKYNSRIPDVIDRFRKNFDPDKFILRFDATFQAEQAVRELESGAVADISIKDLLKAEIPETSGLYSIAAQLFNPDLDQEHVSTAVDAYIEERLLDKSDNKKSNIDSDKL